MLSGQLILVTDDGEQRISEGMCIGFPAGVKNGHHFINRSDKQAKFIVIGSRVDGDQANYPDDNFKWVIDSHGEWVPAKKMARHTDSEGPDIKKPLVSIVEVDD